MQSLMKTCLKHQKRMTWQEARLADQDNDGVAYSMRLLEIFIEECDKEGIDWKSPMEEALIIKLGEAGKSTDTNLSQVTREVEVEWYDFFPPVGFLRHCFGIFA